MNNQTNPLADVSRKAGVDSTSAFPRDAAGVERVKPCPPRKLSPRSYARFSQARRQRPFARLLLEAEAGRGEMQVSVSEAKVIYRRMFGRDRDEPHVWRAFAGNKILIRKDWP